MKDKEKQIEEIAKLLCEYCHDMTEENECPYEHEVSKQLCYNSQLDQATRIYNAGYRKPPFYNSNSETITIPKEMLPKLQVIIGSRCSGKDYLTKIASDSYEKGSKETAEKIIKWFKENSICIPSDEDINEFAKQFGVEIKE